MPVRFQLVVDCTDPESLARFWAAALGYELEPPPDGFATWDDWRRDLGLPEEELGGGPDSIVDPRGEGPRIWFHEVPDAKVVKNRLHLDVTVDDIEAAVGAAKVLGATRIGAIVLDPVSDFQVMLDPEGNEFCFVT